MSGSVAGPAATGPTSDYWAIPNDPLTQPTNAFKDALPCYHGPIPGDALYAILIPAVGGQVYRACTTDAYVTCHVQVMTPAEVVAEGYPETWGPYFA